MSAFNKSCGEFEIDVGEPWPRWVTVRGEGGAIGKFRSDQLYDLQYVVGRAIAFVETAERETFSRRGA